LIYQTTWTLQGDTGHYKGTLDLATTELIAAIGAETSLGLTGEFYLVDVDSNMRCSTQFALTVLGAVTTGTETGPTSVYLGNNSCVREELIGGVKYLVFYNSDGIEYMRIGPPGA
jgi:hypothetical protein